jgi:hypothetical protein
MRVHEDVEAILFCLAQYADSVFNPCLIVLPRTCMFYRLPCEDISYSIVAPASEAREMCGGIVEGKWSVYERDIVAVKELLGDMRRQIRGRGELRIGGAINSVLWIRKISVQILSTIVQVCAHKNDLTILGVAKCTAVNTQSDGRHDLRSKQRNGYLKSEREARRSGSPYIVWSSSWACGVRSHARHVITSGSSQSGGAFPASAATRVSTLARHGDAEW